MTLITRRAALQGLAAGIIGSALASLPARAANTGGVRCGAIRWDAWYSDTPNTNAWYTKHNLDLPQYQTRAPFFAQRLTSSLMSINGGQADMDAEIAYAAAAGLKYWAFLYYPTTGTDSEFSRAWTLYQASASKSAINWCWIHNYNSLKAINASGDFSTLISQFAQSAYEKTLGGRPLLYLFKNGDGIAANLAASITALRSACSAAGIGNPYVVLMSRTATDKADAGADALSDYAYSNNTTFNTYANLDSSVRTYWETRKLDGVPIIPICMMGWDRRPRIEHPVPWEVAAYGQRSYVGMANSFATATPAEIATHVQACLTWIGANPSTVPANNLLMYAWNEFDEGGWLCPTWTASGPDASRLTALTGVI
jgi:hypothetical protein